MHATFDHEELDERLRVK